MKIYPPLKKCRYLGLFYMKEPKSISQLLAWKSQAFGVNPQIYAQFGLAGHNGIDWACTEGTPVYASHDGKVRWLGIDSHGGLGIELETDGFRTRYWHFKEFGVFMGATVKQGDIIGLSGNTGFSSGPHLHFDLKRIDGNGNTLDKDNGYLGAIDPSGYFVWWYNEVVMTQDEVKKQYKLSFYRLPTADELAYWTGKPLLEFLNTAIADRAQFLAQP